MKHGKKIRPKLKLNGFSLEKNRSDVIIKIYSLPHVSRNKNHLLLQNLNIHKLKYADIYNKQHYKTKTKLS